MLTKFTMNNPTKEHKRIAQKLLNLSLKKLMPIVAFGVRWRLGSCTRFAEAKKLISEM